MQFISRAALIGVLLCAPFVAQVALARQNATSQAPATEQRARIAPGSVIPALLARNIDVKKVKTGDPAEARVTQDLKADNGELILAKDTKVEGHITTVQPRSKEQKESQIGIVFDHVATKQGDQLLPLSIQAIVFPVASAAENSGSGGPTPYGGGMANDTTPGGRPSSMSAPPPSTGGETPSGGGKLTMPPITAKTEGVVGNPTLKLAEAGPQGSVVSSDKGNVKLESGTMMLLRVNP